MNDVPDTKAQLIAELKTLRARIAALEASAPEEKLQKSEAHYHNLFEALFNTHLDAVFIFDQNGRFLDVNQVALERYGYSRETFLGMHVFALTPPDMREKAQQLFQNPLTHKVHMDWRHCCKDGSEFPVEISVVPFTYQGKAAILATAHDISERIQAETALRESEQRYRDLLENSLDACMLTTPYGDILYANPAACALFGYSEAELKVGGRSLIVDQNDPRLPEILEKRQNHGRIKHNITLIRRDGTKFESEFSSALFTTNDGQIQTSMFFRDITKRLEAEKALSQSEQHFKDLFESFPLASFIWRGNENGEFILVDVNRTADEITQNRAHEFIGLNATKIYADRPDILKNLKKCFQEKSVFNQETKYTTRSTGLTEHFVFTYVFVEPDLIMLHSENVTEGTLAVEALRENEERFRAIITSMDDIIYTMDTEQRHTGVFGNWVTNSGLTPDFFLGKTPSEIIGPEAARVHIIHNERALAGERVIYEWQGAENGEARHYQMSVSPLIGDDNQLYGLVGVGRDITKIKEAAEALREGEAKLRTLFDLLPVGVSVLNPERQIEEINVALQNILAITQEGLFRGDYTKRQYLRPDGTTMPFKEFASMRTWAERRPVHNVETGVVKEDGDIVWTAVSAAPLPDGRTVIITSDITERKRAEAEQKTRELQLLEDQRLKSLGLLAGGVAHDINNLLTPIMINIELLLMAHATSPKAGQLLQSVEHTTRKIRDIVQQMLVYAGRGQPTLGKVDLNLIINEIASLLQASLPKNTVLEIDLASENLLMQGDPTQLEQVLMNLILNASEAFDGQTGQIFVSTRRQRSADLTDGDEVVVIVSDNGPGIKAEDLTQIFDPFFTTKTTGRGLGLSAVRGIIHTHGGDMKVASRFGVGTTFTIRLPLIGTEPDPNPKKSANTASAAPLQGLWLIIDDEEMVRQAAREVLKMLGARIIEAPNGAIGLKRASEHGDELEGVLLDLTMPGMNGRTVFQHLRSTYPTLPVVLASGYSDHEVQDLLAQPKVAFVAKPFKIKLLHQTMQSLLD